MKSVLAVLAQIALSASNYAVFVAMARWLDEAAFVAFSTAVGLNMLAYALAEAGVSYVAPKALAERQDERGPPLAGAYLALSTVLYLLGIVGGYGVWNGLASEPLNLAWVSAYAAFFVPALLMPAWITCWSMDRSGLVWVVVVRAAIVGAVCLSPSHVTLWLCGAGFAGLVAWLLVRGNLIRMVVAWPNAAAMRLAIAGVREVFVARAMSYVMYALLPLAVGVVRDNSAAAAYVTAERLKSLYATLFQPLMQSMYLWQFRGATSARHKFLAVATLQVVNVLACAVALVASQLGWLDALGPRFTAVPFVAMAWIAAALSVASACLLLLKVFPAADFGIFRRAAMAQMLAFLAIGAWLVAYPSHPVVWLLVGGELALLLAVAGQLALRAARPAAPPQPVDLEDPNRK